MSETYFWVAALLDQVLNLDLRPNFKIARVLRVPSPKIFDTVPPPDHSRVPLAAWLSSASHQIGQ